MPLVPAKCTVCGAILTINSDEDAAVCNSCGNAFVVEKAINNYNTYNTINAETVVVQGADAEQFIKNGTTYIQLGDYDKALGYYEKMTEHFPDDSRGWWGLICCHTKDFTICYPDYEAILKWFRYARKLASDECTKLSMLSTYKRYLRMQAKIDADKEIKTLDELYSVNCSHIAEAEEKKAEIEKARIAHQDERKRLEKDLADKRFNKQTDGEVVKGTAIAAVIAIIIAIILFANGKVLWGLVVGFIGFIIIIMACGFNSDSSMGRGPRNTSQKTHDSIINGAEQRLAYFNKTVAEQIANENKAYESLQTTIAVHMAENKKIEDSKLLSFEERIEQHLQKRISEADVI